MKMKKKSLSLLIIILAIALIFILSLIFDTQISSFFIMLRAKTGISLDFVEQDLIIYPIILFFQVLFVLIDSPAWKDKKKNIFYFVLSLIITFLVTTLLRAVIPRERPLPSQHKFLIDVSLDKNSFPSGHTSFTFTLFSFIKKKALVIIWIVFSIFIMISRLWNGMHYPSDVIAGAIIGYFVPILFVKLIKRIK